MTDFVQTAGGARIAYEAWGEGPPVIQVDGAFQHRAIDPGGRELLTELAARGFTTVQFDRPGRGETEAPVPCTLTDSIAAVRALVELTGPATLLGVSSGAAISLAAAASGVPVQRLILWEAPLGPDGGTDGADFLLGLRQVLASGDAAASVRYFMRDFPPEWVAQAESGPAWPMMTSVAASLEADSEAVAWTQSAPRAELFAGITVPALVLVGEPTLPDFPPAAQSLAATLPDARLVTVPADAPHQPQHQPLLELVEGFLRR
jgi:pimeloyl-ACP methyl ester carboxylesterase